MTQQNKIDNIRTQLRKIQQELKTATPEERRPLLERSRDLNLQLAKVAAQ